MNSFRDRDLAPLDGRADPGGASGAGSLLPQLGTMIYLPILYSAFCLYLSTFNYPLFHTVVELGAVMLGAVVMLVALTAHQLTRSTFITVVSVGLGWTALIDLAHTLAYEGMNLLPGGGGNLSTQLWIAARMLQALSLLGATYLFTRTVSVYLLQGVLLAYALCVWALLATGFFPETFDEETGLTPFKIAAEYAVILMFMLSSWRLWRRRSMVSPQAQACMQLALLFLVLAELLFTLYLDVFDYTNSIGHVLKTFAFWFIFRALVQTTLQEPFSMLSRSASSYNAVPYPTVLVDDSKRILQINTAGLNFLGKRPEEVALAPAHLLHDPQLGQDACPLCQQHVAQGREVELEFRRGAQTFVCRIVPYEGSFGRGASVQIIREVTQQRALTRERENLLFTLRERVKELTCLHRLAQIEERPYLEQREYLEGVVSVLPAAFQHDQLALADIDSRWGHFGSQLKPAGRHVLRETLYEEDKPVGTLQVAYSADGTDGQRDFLAEEVTLMRTVAQRVSHVLTRIYQRQRISGLSFLYELMSDTNRAIAHCRSREALLEELFHLFGRREHFPVVAVAIRSEGATGYTLPQAKGLATTPVLVGMLEDVDIGVASAPANKGCFRQLELDGVVGMEQVLDRGITRLGMLALRSPSRHVGWLVLGLSGQQAFYSETQQLLEQMGEELAFALAAFEEVDLRVLAESRAQRSEQKFAAVFEFAPLPMLIMDSSGMQLIYANRAFYSWLGYEPGEITTADQWFARVVDEPQRLGDIRAQWVRDVEEIRRTGVTRHFKGEHLRCKDGRSVVGDASFSLVGDQVILTYTDVTEVTLSRLKLQESEQRFRTIIEQMHIAIFVRRDERFVYVNPSYCELLGYAREELMEMDVSKLVVDAPTVLANLGSLRYPDPGTHSDYLLPLRHKSGARLDVRINLSNVPWDGDGAFIGTAQDVTERLKWERELESSHRLLQRLSEQVPGLIYQFRLFPDGRSCFPFASDRLREIYEVTPEEVREDASSVYERLHPEDRPDVERSIIESARQLTEWKHDYRVVLPRQGVRWRSGFSRPEKLEDGSVLWHGYIDDSTERKEVEARLADHTRQLERSMRGTLEVMARMVDLRDPYTAGHELRVGRIARDLALELGMSVQEAAMVEQVGIIHDIGKIAVPAEILNKPTQLSPAEMTIVRGHAQAGFDILKDVPLPARFAEMVYQHHERLDGSGYPRGLKGDAILLEARILAVADVVESMASHRPYRPARGIDAALAELESGKGRSYDPRVVDALFTMVHKRGYSVL